MKEQEEFAGFSSIKKNRNFIICSVQENLAPREPGYTEDFLVMRQDNKQEFKIGDLRIKFSIVPCPEATICMRQTQQDEEGSFNFKPHYEVEKPKPIEQLSNGGILSAFKDVFCEQYKTPENLLGGLYNEPIDVCVNFGRKPYDVLVKNMEATMRVARWFRLIVPILLTLMTYMSVACSPIRPSVCI